MPRCSLTSIGRGRISTCWTIRGSSSLTSTWPPQSGQAVQEYSHVLSISSREKGARWWRGCPGWAPRLRLPLPLRAGFGGLTISPEGGLDELEEFFLAAVSSASSFARRAVSSAIFSISSAHRGQPPGWRPSIINPGYRLTRYQPRAILEP